MRHANNMDAILKTYDAVGHLVRQREWSTKTFGPMDGNAPRTAGVIDHIRKELREIEANPTDVEEFVDVMILASDGALRNGAMPVRLVEEWKRQAAWSWNVRKDNAIDFMERALKDIEQDPGMVDRWAILITLAVIAARVMTGATNEVIRDEWRAKQFKNESRTWPDWRTAAPGKAVEHVRTAEEIAAKEAAATPPSSNERPCMTCGSKMMVPAGTCSFCLNCGTTTGCS